MPRLTFNGGYVPIWTPDDQRVTFASPQTGTAPFFISWKPADGTGLEEPLVAAEEPLLAMGSVWPFSWPPDARTLVFRQRRADGAEDDIGVRK